jgi:hypothetical protein
VKIIIAIITVIDKERYFLFSKNFSILLNMHNT